jgi:hypothetical protein
VNDKIGIEPPASGLLLCPICRSLELNLRLGITHTGIQEETVEQFFFFAHDPKTCP